MSPQKPSTLGHTFIAFARSRLPVPNKPRVRNRRPFLAVAPIPFAPLVDTHAFPPPPPYSAHPDTFLRVPHNSPEQTVVEHDVVVNAAISRNRPVGLGLEGVERGDGNPFDGLGRLGGGFRETTIEALREEMHRRVERRRIRTREQPTKCQDVFYASVDVTCEQVVNSMPAVKILVRRKSVASPTPFDRVRRGTISTELKRAASLERRATLSGSKMVWRA
ncbi:hypothetical protein JVU11DRAFT_11503 [Chiua virens]|nr:hypothetical protein JVU11DRAFT_11503 [Chiua virens]